MYFNLATLNVEMNVYILKNIFLKVDTIIFTHVDAIL